MPPPRRLAQARGAARSIARARARLPDRGAREAVTLYLDSVSLVLAALVALLHPLGYVAVALFAWLCCGCARAPMRSTRACESCVASRHALSGLAAQLSMPHEGCTSLPARW